MKDHREYVRVAVDLPENPKLVDAPIPAKWLYVAALCYAGQHLTDGHVPTVGALSKAGVPKRWLTELSTRDLIHEPGHECKECDQPRPGSFVIHDYLRHQRSRQEAEDSRSGRRRGADLTNHKRWHAEPDPNCRFCRRSSDRSSDRPSESLDRSLTPSLSGRSGIAEVEVEVEGGLGSQSLPAVEANGQSDGLDLGRIKTALRSNDHWAHLVAGQILAKAPRPPGNPTAYVVNAIQREPHLYRETNGPPALGDLCDEHGRDRTTCPPSWHEEHT
jgi:hypothetical protein